MTDMRIALAVLVAYLVTAYLAVWIHELGHAIAGVLVGIPVTAIGAGTGKPLVQIRIGGIVCYAAIRNPFAGFTHAQQDAVSQRWRLAAFYSGGIVANAFAAAATFAIVDIRPHLTWWLGVWIFGSYNAFCATMSLYPFNFRIGRTAFSSDGALLVPLYFTPKQPQPMPFVTACNMLHTFGSMWRAIGERQSLVTCLLIAARTWTELRNPARATTLLAEARSIQDPPSEQSAMLIDMTEVWLAAAEGRADDADRASDAAAAHVSGPGLEMNWLCVELDRTECRIALGDRAGAAAVLDRIADHPALDLPYCRAAYDALAYRIGRAVTPPASLPPDQPTNRLWLLSILADRAAEVEDWAELERLTRAQQVEVKRLAKELASPEDREALDPFREWIKNRLYRAITGQGRDPAVEPPHPPIPSPDPAAAAKQWWRFSLAVAVLMIEFFSILTALLLAAEFRHGPPPRRWIAATLGVYAGLAAFFIFWAGLIIAVYGVMRRRDRSRIADYGTRSMIWAALAFGTPVLICIAIGLTRP